MNRNILNSRDERWYAQRAINVRSFSALLLSRLVSTSAAFDDSPTCQKPSHKTAAGGWNFTQLQKCSNRSSISWQRMADAFFSEKWPAESNDVRALSFCCMTGAQSIRSYTIERSAASTDRASSVCRHNDLFQTRSHNKGKDNYANTLNICMKTDVNEEFSLYWSIRSRSKTRYLRLD